MPVLQNRAILWAFALLVVGLMVVDFSSEASADVYQGPLDFDTLPAFTMTLTLQPSGPALYTMRVGNFTDRGFFLAATVSGSRVVGYFQTTALTARACNFQGTYDGTTAILILDPFSCGGGGTLTLTRIA